MTRSLEKPDDQIGLQGCASTVKLLERLLNEDGDPLSPDELEAWIDTVNHEYHQFETHDLYEKLICDAEEDVHPSWSIAP